MDQKKIRNRFFIIIRIILLLAAAGNILITVFAVFSDNYTDRSELISEVTEINDAIETCATDTNSNVGTGGMITKINASKLCMEKGIDVVLANGKDMKIIKDILEGEEIGTYFRSTKND